MFLRECVAGGARNGTQTRLQGQELRFIRDERSALGFDFGLLPADSIGTRLLNFSAVRQY